MKALLVTTMIIAGSLAASTGYSQVYVHARFGIGIPAPRVYYAPAPIYAPAPAPVAYQDEYAPDYAPAPVVDEYPVETYFDLYPNYPAWGGHYRDQVYFAHYRPFFDRYRRDHISEFNRFHGQRNYDRGYARGNDRGYARGSNDRGYARNNDRGYARGNDRGHEGHFDHNRR